MNLPINKINNGSLKVIEFQQKITMSEQVPGISSKMEIMPKRIRGSRGGRYMNEKLLVIGKTMNEGKV